MVRSFIGLFAVICCVGLSTLLGAATFDPVREPADSKIKNLSEYFESSVFPEVNTNDRGSAFAAHYKILSKKVVEPWIKTVKQLIYIERAKWDKYGMPDDVEAKEAPKTTYWLQQIASAFIFEHMNKYKEKREALRQKINTELSNFKYTLIVGSDSNSFRECSWVAVVRKIQLDISLLQSCYSL